MAPAQSQAMNEDEGRKKLSELRLLQAQVQEGTRQLEAFASMREEVREAQLSLDNLPSSPRSSLVPLGAGVFVKASLSSQEPLLVDVGARVYAEKTVDEAKAILKTKGEQLDKASSAIQGELDKLVSRAQALQMQLQGQ